MTDELPIHDYLHDADRWSVHSRGASRRILRLMARIARHQRDRDNQMVGCRVLGGEG